jgi:hypothetical protein
MGPEHLDRCRSGLGGLVDGDVEGAVPDAHGP